MRRSRAAPSLRLLSLTWVVAAAPCGAQNTQTEDETIGASDALDGDLFGAPVAVDGPTCVAGASEHDHVATNAGAAFVFAEAAGSWSEVAELLASDGKRGDRFGRSVAIDGDFLAVGAPLADSATPGITNRGAVYVFQRVSGVWTEVQKLAPTDENQAQAFGEDVDLAGDLLVVGAPGDDDGGTEAGAVYVYRYSGALWSQETKLRPSDSGASQEVGYRVATDGTTAIAGAPEDGAGVGAAYVFRVQGTTWSEEQKLVPSAAGGGDFFGNDVAIEGDRAVVASEDFQGVGAAVPWSFDGAQWNEEPALEPSDGQSGDLFGTSVALSGSVVVVGAIAASSSQASGSGAAYLYRHGGTQWVEQVKLELSTGATDDAFGFCGLDGKRLVIGAPVAGGAGAIGAFTVFDLSFDTNQDDYQAGDLATLTASGGVPGLPALIYALAPFVAQIGVGVFDSAGEFGIGGQVPPGLSGLQVTFVAFGFHRVGKVGQSNLKVVTFL